MSIKETIIAELNTKIANREEQLNHINLAISMESIGSELLYSMMKLADSLADSLVTLRDELEDYKS